MRLRALLIGAAASVVVAGPAVAATLPDLPGMGVVADVVDADVDGGLPGTGGLTTANQGIDDLDLPGLGTANDAAADAADQADDAAPKSAKSDDDLPSTGAAVAGFSMLGAALTAGGALLRELIRPLRG